MMLTDQELQSLRNLGNDAEKAADEIELLRGKVALMLCAMEFAAHQMGKARIWGGMEWHYNPLHPMHYKPAIERLREVLDENNSPPHPLPR